MSVLLPLSLLSLFLSPSSPLAGGRAWAAVWRRPAGAEAVPTVEESTMARPALGEMGSASVLRTSRRQGCEHVAEEDGHDRRRFPRDYVDYLYLFDCVFGVERRVLGYGVMAAWLAVLFYLLGDTAAVYFCSSLKGLSWLLRLSRRSPA
uniref:Uncharacterized protein n=1 Tax=Oryza sativa subsp. japonica TaxID=39947 RepID=Q10H63_ORYSJ|nr:hypothetical protein LOC_Os03g40320 [Oryza sativa Japonica Group]